MSFAYLKGCVKVSFVVNSRVSIIEFISYAHSVDQLSYSCAAAFGNSVEDEMAS